MTRRKPQQLALLDVPETSPATLSPTTQTWFSTADCNAAYRVWTTARGAMHYGRFRKALAPVWKDAAFPATASERLAALEWALAMSDSRITPEQIAGNWSEWLRVARMEPWARERMLLRVTSAQRAR